MVGLTPRGQLYAMTDSTPSHPPAVVTQDLLGGPRKIYKGTGEKTFSNVLFDARRGLVLAGGARLRVWDERTGSAIRSRDLDNPRGGNDGITMSPDGAFVVSFGDQPTVWNTATWSRIGRLEGHVGDGVGVGDGIVGEFVNPTTLVTVALAEGTARVWDVATLRPLMAFPGTQTLHFSEDRRFVVLTGPAGSGSGSRSSPSPASPRRAPPTTSAPPPG